MYIGSRGCFCSCIFQSESELHVLSRAALFCGGSSCVPVYTFTVTAPPMIEASWRRESDDNEVLI